MQFEVGDVDTVRVDRTHDVGEPEPVVEPDGDVARRGERLAELREEGGDLRPVVLGTRNRVNARSADLGLELRGVPSATIFPWSMIPTRSARTSASSRYWVVRNTVTPASRRMSATSFQMSVRLCGSSPVVGSSRKRMRGLCTRASARSSRRFIPPE